jgi:hypothetical protein
MKQNEVRKTTCPNFTEILGKTLGLPRKKQPEAPEGLRHKKKVWHLDRKSHKTTLLHPTF